jgi:dTDP-4-amino-4,6-dideoxygalactose transaminase
MSGSPDRIRLSENSIGQLEKESVSEALSQPWLINGPYVVKFETRMGEFLGCRHAIAVTSCTTGMQVALASLGPRNGDECILPAFNFCAAAQAVRASGFMPVLCDVGLDGNMRAEDIERVAGPKTRAVLGLHYAGWPLDLEEIASCCQNLGVAMISDAAHALGATYDGRQVSEHCDAAVYSFGPTKHVVAGMGGLIATDREDIAAFARGYRSYGMDASMYDRQDDKHPWYYDVPAQGNNFRMSDINASVALPQLDKWPAIVERRRVVAGDYARSIERLNLVDCLQPLTDSRREHACLYQVIRLRAAMSRDEVCSYLNRHGINASVHWARTLNEFSAFADSRAPGSVENSIRLAASILSLPLHQNMTSENVSRVAECLDQALKQAGDR